MQANRELEWVGKELLPVGSRKPEPASDKVSLPPLAQKRSTHPIALIDCLPASMAPTASPCLAGIPQLCPVSLPTMPCSCLHAFAER